MQGKDKAVRETGVKDCDHGALVTEAGEEVAITEEMIRSAIKELDPEADDDSPAQSSS